VRRAAAAVLLGLLAAACGEEAPPAKQPAAAAETAGEDEAAPAPGTPAPPSPIPALNLFAETCLHEPPPAAAQAAGAFATDCFGHLLETLRAAIGVAEAPQTEVGPRLDEAELAVRNLSAGPAAPDAAARARRAADGLVALAGSVLKARTEVPPPALREARRAAEAIAPERPLAAQGEELVAFFRAADAVVRPLVRELLAAGEPGEAAPEPD
jgi:hypothetical protein